MAGTSKKKEASATASKEEEKGDSVAPTAAEAEAEKKAEASTKDTQESKDDSKEKDMPPLKLATEKKEVPKPKGEVLKRPQDASAVVTRNGKTWNEMFDCLVEFKAREGKTMVPDRFKTDDGVCLGLWVRNQRRRKDSLTEDQRKRLTDLGLDWQTQNERFDQVWHDRYAKLTEYALHHGYVRLLAVRLFETSFPGMVCFLVFHCFVCVSQQRMHPSIFLFPHDPPPPFHHYQTTPTQGLPCPLYL